MHARTDAPSATSNNNDFGYDYACKPLEAAATLNGQREYSHLALIHKVGYEFWAGSYLEERKAH